MNTAVMAIWMLTPFLTLVPSVCCVFLFRQLYHTTQCTLSNSDIRWQDKFNGTFDTIFLLFTDQWQGVSRSFQKSPYRAKKYALRESLANDIDTPCIWCQNSWLYVLFFSIIFYRTKHLNKYVKSQQDENIN